MIITLVSASSFRKKRRFASKRFLSQTVSHLLLFSLSQTILADVVCAIGGRQKKNLSSIFIWWLSANVRYRITSGNGYCFLFSLFFRKQKIDDAVNSCHYRTRTHSERYRKCLLWQRRNIQHTKWPVERKHTNNRRHRLESNRFSCTVHPFFHVQWCCRRYASAKKRYEKKIEFLPAFVLLPRLILAALVPSAIYSVHFECDIKHMFPRAHRS